MKSIKQIVNSDSSLSLAQAETAELYRKNKYLVVTVKVGRDRTEEQNRLQRKWMLELEGQGDMSAEEYRGFCKLHFGVPIMLNECPDFAEVYNRLIAPMDYQDKLALMMVPMDLPLTRIMSRSQKSRYLDAIWHHFTIEGFRLTETDRKK